MIAASLAGHLVHDLRAPDDPSRPSPNRPWRLDPVPLVLDGAGVRRAGRRRDGSGMQAMEVLLADLYGPAPAVREGWVPAEALASSERYRLAAVGAPPPPRWLTTYAVDVVAAAPTGRGASSRTSPTRRPASATRCSTGRSWRGVAAELLGPEGTGDLASISGFPAELRHALATLTAARSPRIVLFTGGVDDAGVRRALGAGPAARVPPRRAARPRRAAGPAVAAHARRPRPDRRRLPPPVRRRARPDRGQRHRQRRRARARAGRRPRAASCSPTPTASGVLEDPALAPFWPAAVEGLTGTSLTLGDARDASDELAAVPAFRRRPGRQPPTSSSACTPSPDPTA